MANDTKADTPIPEVRARLGVPKGWRGNSDIEVKLPKDPLGALVCPSCGGNNLHHDRVASFVRTGEDKLGLVATTKADGSAEILPVLDDGQFAGRRDEVVARFWCEQCSNDGAKGQGFRLYLMLIQHKGTTFLGWVEGGRNAVGAPAKL